MAEPIPSIEGDLIPADESAYVDEVNLSNLTKEDQHVYTQNIRRRLISRLMPKSDSAILNMDPKILTNLKGLLADYDKVTLGLRKLTVEEESNDIQRQALKDFVDISQLMGNKDPLRVEEATRAGPPVFDASEVKSYEMVQGGVRVGEDPVVYDQLMAEQREISRKALE